MSLGGFQIIVYLLSHKKSVPIEFYETLEPQVQGYLGDSRFNIFRVKTHFPK